MVLAILVLMVGLSEGGQEKRIIQASEVEATIKAGEPAEFDDCMVVGYLNLSGLKIEQPVHFNHTIFQDSVTFNYSTFNGNAYFWNSVFNGVADFGNSVFNGMADFGNSDFNGISIVMSTHVFFHGTAYFGSSVFNDVAHFDSSKFISSACFESSVFNDIAEFRNSGFNGNAYFSYSRFDGNAGFENSHFNGTAGFDFSDFNDNAHFFKSIFNSAAYFRGTTFSKDAEFSEVVFKKYANFDKSQFNGNAFFKNTTFDSKLSLTDTTYNKLIIRWHNIKQFVYDDAAYMSLMKNFKELGYFEDYDSCYFQYRKEHRGQPWLTVPDWEEWARKFIDYPLQWFYGYGTKPFNAFLWSLVIVFTFFIYWWSIGLGGPNDKTKDSLKDGEEWLDGDLTDILGFSVTVFISGTKFFIDPPALPKIEGRSRSWIKKAFILERVLGALFSVLFFIAISGTIVRAA